MKKFWSFVCILALLLSMTLPVLAETDDTVPETTVETTEVLAGGNAALQQNSALASCKGLDSQSPITSGTKFTLFGRSAIVYDCTSDTLVTSYNADQRAYPSSQTKIMVCLLAAENLDPNEVITVSSAAISEVSYQYYTTGFEVAEQLTVMDLMQAAYLDSGNDAVVILGMRIAGSMEAFLDMMNQRAAELGCTGTNFQNCYGIQHPEHYTTARDLAKIVAEGMKYDSFMECYTAVKYEIPANEYAEARTFYSDNYLQFQSSMFAYYDERVQGGRMCRTDEDLYNIVVTVKEGSMRLLVVVMEATYVYNEKIFGITSFGNIEDAITLYNYAFDHLQYTNVAYTGQSITQQAVTGGANDVVLGAKESVSAVLPKTVKASDIRQVITVKKDLLTAPLNMGKTLGTLELWYGTTCIGTTDLISLSSVAVGSPDNPLEPTVAVAEGETGNTNILSMVLQIFGGIFIVILLLFLLLVFRSSRIRRKQQKRSTRQRRANQRRRSL